MGEKLIEMRGRGDSPGRYYAENAGSTYSSVKSKEVQKTLTQKRN